MFENFQTMKTHQISEVERGAKLRQRMQGTDAHSREQIAYKENDD